MSIAGTEAALFPPQHSLILLHLIVIRVVMTFKNMILLMMSLIFLHLIKNMMIYNAFDDDFCILLNFIVITNNMMIC